MKCTSQRDEQAAAPRTLAEVDLSAIAAALAELEATTADMPVGPAPGGRSPRTSELDSRRRQQDRKLAAARAWAAEIEAEATA